MYFQVLQNLNQEQIQFATIVLVFGFWFFLFIFHRGILASWAYKDWLLKLRLFRSVPIFDQDSSLVRAEVCSSYIDDTIVLIFCCSFLSWTPLDRLLKTVYRLAYGRRNRTRKAEDEKEKEDVPHSNPLLKVFNRIRSHDILWKLLWHRLDASLSRPHISYIEPRVTIPDRTTQAQTDTQ